MSARPDVIGHSGVSDRARGEADVAGICEGRSVIVTGAGRGLGRAHALAFARAGANVIVNDIGASLDGHPTAESPGDEVVAEIQAMGGTAQVNGDDISSWSGAGNLVAQCVETFGGLDVIVNNAGFLRDRMLASVSEEEWDAVIAVHLKGHMATARHAIEFWRSQSKAGAEVSGRVINTSSGAGLLGSVGQGNYSAAKAAIVGLTLVQSAEWGRYGVTANAIAPAARTRMTETVFADMMAEVDGESFDAMAPDNVSPLLVYLGSVYSGAVTGRVFEVEGGKISLMDGWRPGATVDKGARWEPEELNAAVGQLIAEAPSPLPVYGAS
ncbi:MAG: SDR family oxidoreductase [Acidimicrobiia bacterium]|jgi:NAD(P)-dependent dehydrogenase (short-subunit alcohol dehydrogenase family)|nr:SDR family oxidoreductase [Acidimicrobiia bacterium]MBP8180106.1 SDR family oxidoreductase [Acidimicrobiia bacterium]